MGIRSCYWLRPFSRVSIGSAMPLLVQKGTYLHGQLNGKDHTHHMVDDGQCLGAESQPWIREPGRQNLIELWANFIIQAGTHHCHFCRVKSLWTFPRWPGLLVDWSTAGRGCEVVKIGIHWDPRRFARQSHLFRRLNTRHKPDFRRGI